MTKEYRTQMNPVRVRASRASVTLSQNHHWPCLPVFCDTLSFSAGRLRSFNPAATKHHFIIGAQKKIVLGPGCYEFRIERLGYVGSNLLDGS